MDLKGLVENLVRFLHLGPLAVRQMDAHPYYEPAVEVLVNGESIGVMGQVKTESADRANARFPVWMAELNLETVRRLHDRGGIAFQNLDVYPPVRRDITVVAPEHMKVEAIRSAMLGLKLPLLQEVALADVFEPEGKPVRNLTFRLTFRHAERTLRDAEVDKLRDKIVASLTKDLGVTI